MKVLIVDNNGCSFPDIGYQIKHTLEKASHETRTFNYRFLKLNKFFLTNRLLNTLLIKFARIWRPDLLLVIKGESLIPGTISKISGESITTAAWNPDEPFGAVLPFNRIRNLTEYDYYFIYDERYAKQLKEINPNSYYLPFGPDVDVHREQIPLWMRSYKYDISFVGTAYSNRQYLLEQISKKHSSLAIYGHGWSQASKQLKKFVNKKVPMGPALAYVFNESKINLNIYGPSQKFVVPNPRTFEIPASRNFQLATYHKSITRHFKPGKEIVLYRNEDELFELIDWYLDNDEEREKVAQAGYDRVLKEHTMRHRLQRMFKIMNMKL